MVSKCYYQSPSCNSQKRNNVPFVLLQEILQDQPSAKQTPLTRFSNVPPAIQHFLFVTNPLSLTKKGGSYQPGTPFFSFQSSTIFVAKIEEVLTGNDDLTGEDQQKPLP